MKILVAGDLSPKFESSRMIETGDFEGLFKEIKPFTSNADINIVNFETVITNDKCIPIPKNGPNLSTPKNIVKALKYAGFNTVTLANNHFYDFGDEAVELSLNHFTANDISYVGAGRNINEAEQTLFIERDGFRIAIINCCETEFSIASEHHGGSNPLNPIQQYYRIQEAKINSDYIIVIVHGGHECFQLPNLRMQETYRFFIDTGANCVINHHQHCFSGMEIYKECPIFYGLGNFLFDKRKNVYPDSWLEGFFVVLDLNEKNSKASFEIIPYTQSYPKPGIHLLKNDDDKNKFWNRFNELNSIISDRYKLEEELCRFYCKDIRGSLQAFEPYSNKYLRAAYYRKLLPSFLTKSKLFHLLNYISCESHLDKSKFLLNKLSKTAK